MSVTITVTDRYGRDSASPKGREGERFMAYFTDHKRFVRSAFGASRQEAIDNLRREHPEARKMRVVSK